MINQNTQPVGIIPQRTHDEKRYCDLRQTIIKYIKGDWQVPIEWIEEYNELLELGKIDVK